MGFVHQERGSDAPYVEKIMQGYTVGNGTVIRPSETNWHMVVVRIHGTAIPIMAGPLTSSGVVQFHEGVELLWIQFKLGAFMPHLPAKGQVNIETQLPSAGTQKFWLKGAARELPSYENADTFIERLAREEILMFDPLVPRVLEEHPHDFAERTVRHRFLQATGLTQAHIRQAQRAQQAVQLLQQGVSILDTVDSLGYFDQPHLTRSLKHFVGHTPTQIAAVSNSLTPVTV